MSGFLIRYLGFYGPDKKSADIEFEAGLNVICGASDTGKSLVAESLDFMFGQEAPIRGVPERDGYERIRLSIESNICPPLTLERSVDGGNFNAYDELLFEEKTTTEKRVLRWKHSASRQDTVSHSLLERSGISTKYLRKNAKGETRTLSFRDLARLCIVTEEEIQRRTSPLLSSHFVTKTVETSVFKLLITGTDDSAFVAASDKASLREPNTGKIELLDKMIKELQLELDEQGADEGDLTDQIQKLEASIEKQNNALTTVQRELDGLLERRGDAARKLRDIKARNVEISELLARFDLLDAHYKSDLKRLEAIHESGSFFVHLEKQRCPLCGAEPQDQHVDDDCEGNTEAVVRAVNAEILKINRLRSELNGTTEYLQQEQSQLSASVSEHRGEYNDSDRQLSEIASPSVYRERTAYNQLISKRSEVHLAFDKIERLNHLTEQRDLLNKESSDNGGPLTSAGVSMSKNVLNEFSKTVENILEEWHYPNPSRVFFDEKKLDFQIDGKERGSSGKGLRAITHAAFSIGLMEFCRERGLPHPGIVVLDSPLLAYWKPEGEEDNLSSTDLDEMFYRYLLGLSNETQVIILENKHPPDFVNIEAKVTVFTKNPYQGRYGLFPVNS